MVLGYIRRSIEAWQDYPCEPGEIIADRYKIHELLGEGSYGLTYACTDEQDGRIYALKQARPSKKARGELLLKQEAAALSQMEHPHIPALKAAFTYKKRQYMVTTFVEGRNMEELIFQEQLQFNERECVSYMLSLLDLVEYVHERGFVHMDLRIPNVIQHGHDLYLIDFGLAMPSGEEPATAAIQQLLSERDPQRRHPVIQSDLYDLGHHLLFLLYTSYETAMATESESSAPKQPPAGWQQELQLHSGTRHVLERLLQLGPCYENTHELRCDLQMLHTQLEGEFH